MLKKEIFKSVGGDFNQWKVEDVMADFPDIDEFGVGPTRGARCIDRTFANFHTMIEEADAVPPLEVDDDLTKRSDHKIAYVLAALQRSASLKWIMYSY